MRRKGFSTIAISVTVVLVFALCPVAWAGDDTSGTQVASQDIYTARTMDGVV